MTVVQVGGTPDDPGAARYSGAIKADESVDLAFRVSGIVEAITQVRGADGRLRAIQDGDQVRKGQVLARLREIEYRDQVADADAALRQAQPTTNAPRSSTRTARSARQSTMPPTPATPRPRPGGAWRRSRWATPRCGRRSTG